MKSSSNLVLSFRKLKAEEEVYAGGKGGTLARLYRAGYSVPDGFVIMSTAFDEDKLLPEAWEQVRVHLNRIWKKDKDVSFAVRSSALSEDSAQASFAGEFETVLDVKTEEEIRQAIYTVRQSRLSERVKAYSQAKGMDFQHEIAVVIQQLVRADLSGILFTADPVTGNRNQMTGNFIYGLGDKLVSGEVNAEEFSFYRPKGRYEGSSELKSIAPKLYKLGEMLERDLGCPQDIEWAVMRNKLYLLQSRPITTFVEYDPLTGEWNSTFSGDYLWTNFISAEVFPIAASPSTWSLWQLFFERMFSFGDLVALGNIAYRPYLNYSLMYSFLMKILRKHERVVGVVGDSIGTPPENIEIPTMPIPLKTLLFKLIPREIKNNFAKKKLKNLIPDFFTDIFDQCQDLKKQINQIKEKNDLISIWREKIKPIYFDIQLLQDALNEDLNGFNRTLKKNLGKFLGEEDINTFFTSLSSQSEQLASIGQLVGLAKIKNGNLSREDYMSLYGHRGPYENYLLIPRPYEDPSWLEKQLEEFNRSPVDVENLLMKRASEFDAIWHKLKQKVKPKHAQTFKQLIDKIQNTFLEREQIRSELTRLVGIIREWFLRAGDLTELGEDIFYLTIDEVIETLLGDHSSTSYIPARRETYAKYRSLTSLPIWIRGRFDPIQWDNNPDRRFDYFDPYTSVSSILDTGDIIKGNPGSAGRVEGVVRRIDSLEEGHLLQSGEILVTNSTNIGWTPIFPRLTAVITDVGAALSHAAIVARELGIPAVVGCRNATTRLKTGDRVLVDGAQGVIKILEVVEKS